jgi:hypothetical protein
MRLITFFLVVYVMGLMGCGKDDPQPSANDITTELLRSKPWQLSSTTIDGTSSNLYSGLSVTFSTNTYTSVNGGKIWLASGTWNLAGDDGKKLLRDGTLQIDIQNISPTQLVISFNWNSTTLDNGRTESLKGLHRMTFQ